MSKIPAPDDLIGGRYRVVKLIGEGGMGAVYEAENVVTKKRVALKWLHPSIADRPEYAQRLVREAQAASRVRHPNVVDVYDVVTTDDTIFLILELLEGEPLYELLDRGGMKVPQFIGLLIQAMRGVGAAHQEGVIHRDVHPGNIFLERQRDRSDFHVKVLDFGISKIAGEAATALTQSGTTIGTPLYMSYEQLCANRDLDVRADIYSFGVILYRALAGRHPFQADSLTDLAVQFATTKPQSVKTLCPEVPSGLDKIVMSCIARDREQRPANLEQLIAELEPFASEDGYRGLLSGRSRQIPVVAGRPSTRLHADGASLIPPTGQSQYPATPGQQVRVVTPSVPLSQVAPAAPAKSSWMLSAAIGAVVAVITGGAVMVLLNRGDVGTASPPGPPPVPKPEVPAVPVPAPARETPEKEKGHQALPPGISTPPVDAEHKEPAGKTPALPAKPRPWVGRQKGTPPPDVPSETNAETKSEAKPVPSDGKDERFRIGRKPTINDFK